jgi:hypothetical protein
MNETFKVAVVFLALVLLVVIFVRGLRPDQPTTHIPESKPRSTAKVCVIDLVETTFKFTQANIEKMPTATLEVLGMAFKAFAKEGCDVTYYEEPIRGYKSVKVVTTYENSVRVTQWVQSLVGNNTVQMTVETVDHERMTYVFD